MPMFTYKCGSCGLVFDKLVSSKEKDGQLCLKCGKASVRNGVESFSVKTPVGEPGEKAIRSNKELDLAVGTDAEKRWIDHERKTKERREGMNEIELGVPAGDKFDPGALLGDTGRKQLSSEFAKELKSGNPAAKSAIGGTLGTLKKDA